MSLYKCSEYVEIIVTIMHELLTIIDRVDNGSEALICCLVRDFTIKFLVINVPRKISGRTTTSIFSVILSYPNESVGKVRQFLNK